MDVGKEVLQDRGLLNLSWHMKGLPPAKHRIRGVYSFLTGSWFKTKQKYTSHNAELWISLLQDKL